MHANLGSRNHTRPVPATRVTQNSFWDANTPDPPPGAFAIDENDLRILFQCPCGCGSLSDLSIRPASTPHPTDGPAWNWDGVHETPTLTPSIRQLSGCRFHGFLTNGVWTFCPDSGNGATR